MIFQRASARLPARVRRNDDTFSFLFPFFLLSERNEGTRGPAEEGGGGRTALEAPGEARLASGCRRRRVREILITSHKCHMPVKEWHSRRPRDNENGA
jgi:hypothetical protein